jgi:hypothetical protein
MGGQKKNEDYKDTTNNIWKKAQNGTQKIHRREASRNPHRVLLRGKAEVKNRSGHSTRVPGEAVWF